MKEEILKILNETYEAKTAMQINDMLEYKKSDEYRDLCIVLEELVNEHQLFKTKKDKYLSLKNTPGIKIGRLAVNKKGFGFVILDREDDLYISKTDMNGAIHNDIVMAEIIRKGIKREGKIIKVITRELHDMVGTVVKVDQYLGVDLDDDKKNIFVRISKESMKNCIEGHKVVVRLTKQIEDKKYYADVIKIIGHKNDPGVDIMSIAYKHQIHDEFPESVINELDDIPTEVRATEKIDRKDLTNEVIFTIDGSHTKDIDDAISFQKESDHYVLGVHIADVSHYVKENTALGDEAYARATSCYLADTVIPMLPHKLSNGICSLNENVERLSLSCVMKIDKKGKIFEYDIFESVIKSCKKMTYEAVNDILHRDIITPGYEDYAQTLKDMNELAHILRKEKIQRGYIDFELDEAEVVQDETGKAIDIIKREREDGEKLIEDFMIAANETVASHIYNMELPFIYRIHGEPKDEKIEDFINLVKILGYQLTGKITDLTSKSMQSLLKQLNDKPEFAILSSMLLRSMKKAEYSKDNIGHFGLASQAYTHFTSPIRRYPDLVVHRLLKKYLIEKDLSLNTINYYDQALVEIAEHTSEKEVNSVNAERDVLDMKMAEYMEDYIGCEYEGIISTVTNFGFFVELENLIEGLVHVSTLKGDFYHYIPETLALIGETTKTTYRIGNKVKIRVTNADKESALIDFEVIPSKKEVKQNGTEE